MKSQPENRITGLWKLLIGTQKPLRLDAAAAALDVSEKTVRRDLTRLNQILQDTDCKVELHKGTCILQGLSRDAEDVMSALQTGIPETQSERVDWLASWFLMNGKATLQSLADRLYISESTIKHDLNVLKNKLKPFQLSLERCSSGLRLEATGGTGSQLPDVLDARRPDPTRFRVGCQPGILCQAGDSEYGGSGRPDHG